MNHPAPTRRARWTPAKQRTFLAALVDTGSIAFAARAAGMSRSSAHRLRTRLAGTPFDRMCGQAIAEHARRLADPFVGLDRAKAAPDARAAVAPVSPGRRDDGALACDSGASR